MKIIPAIDIIGGKCVRLTKGDYDTKKVYNESPLEVAKNFEANGIQFLHLVDLDGAKSSRIVNHKILESIATQTNLQVDFGGGIKSNDDIATAFNSGAKQVTVGSLAIKNPTLFLEWLSKYGAEKMILGADCKNRKIAIQGWEQVSEKEVLSFIQEYEQEGVKNVVCTDIAKDGMLEGSANDLYEEIINQSSVNLIASGGVSSMEDLHSLKAIGCYGAIVGKAIYEGKVSIEELSIFNNLS